MSKEKESANVAGGIDWLVQQNRGRFDPVLFGDYREPQDAIISADYGFFNDAFPTYDFSPFDNKPSMMQQPAKGVIEQADEKQDAEVEPVPSMNTANRVEVDCNKLWFVLSYCSLPNDVLIADSIPHPMKGTVSKATKVTKTVNWILIVSATIFRRKQSVPKPVSSLIRNWLMLYWLNSQRILARTLFHLSIRSEWSHSNENGNGN